MWPARSRGGLDHEIEAQWRGHVVDRGRLDDFCRITGLDCARGLPLLYPHTFGFPLTMALLTHPSFPVPIWGVLQTRNQLVEHRNIPIDARLDFSARLAAARTLAKGAELDLRTEVHVAGELAWESTVTFFTRKRFPTRESPSPHGRAPTELGTCVDEWRMADRHHRRFCSFTGDYNGIHLWTSYARRFGFARALYHPARVLGECLARPSLSGPVRRLDVWLKGPVSHGASVRLHRVEHDERTTFALFAEPDRPAVVGALMRS